MSVFVFALTLFGASLLGLTCFAAALTVSIADIRETPRISIALAIVVCVVAGLLVLLFPQAVVRISAELLWPRGQVALRVLLISFDCALLLGLWIWWQAKSSLLLDRHLRPRLPFRSRSGDRRASAVR